MHSAPAPAPAPTPAPARPHAPCPMPLPLPLPLPLPVQVSRQAGRQASRQASRLASARQPSRQRLGSRLAPEAATVPSHLQHAAWPRRVALGLRSSQSRSRPVPQMAQPLLAVATKKQQDCYLCKIATATSAAAAQVALSVETSLGGALALSVEASALGGALHFQQECGEISLAGDSHTAVLARRPLAPVRPHRGSEGFIYCGISEHDEGGGDVEALGFSNPWRQRHTLAVNLDASTVGDRRQPVQGLGRIG